MTGTLFYCDEDAEKDWPWPLRPTHMDIVMDSKLVVNLTPGELHGAECGWPT